MWLTDETAIKKAKRADKKAYGHEGYDSTYGYVPFQACIDFIKLVNTGLTAGALSTQFGLRVTDVLAIVTYWTQYFKAGDDANDIKCYGGKEYSEIQTLKKKGPLSQEDIQDMMIDLHLFQKKNGEKK